MANVFSLFKRIFGGSQKDYHKVAVKLLVDLVPIYQRTIKKLMEEGNTELVKFSMQGVTPTMSLSSAGIDHFVENNLPESITTILKKDNDTIVGMFAVISAFKESPATGGVSLNPEIVSILYKAFRQEVTKRNLFPPGAAY
ncbi:MAG: hypothetical protein JNJ61_14260 [Anaerolineae bacterium]|nr:hypothetical protein [Anaerolineae bacterium]